MRIILINFCLFVAIFVVERVNISIINNHKMWVIVQSYNTQNLEIARKITFLQKIYDYGWDFVHIPNCN